MRKSVLFLGSLFVVFYGCGHKNKTNKALAQTDSIMPQTKISVHKEYDDQGNLISIDSSYSYFYSNIKNDSINEKEIFNRFKSDFDQRFKSVDSLFTKGLIDGTPFNMDNFYTEDFFRNNLSENQDRINAIFKRMDSIKNSFYKKQLNY